MLWTLNCCVHTSASTWLIFFFLSFFLFSHEGWQEKSSFLHLIPTMSGDMQEHVRAVSWRIRPTFFQKWKIFLCVHAPVKVHLWSSAVGGFVCVCVGVWVYFTCSEWKHHCETPCHIGHGWIHTDTHTHTDTHCTPTRLAALTRATVTTSQGKHLTYTHSLSVFSSLSPFFVLKFSLQACSWLSPFPPSH